MSFRKKTNVKKLLKIAISLQLVQCFKVSGLILINSVKPQFYNILSVSETGFDNELNQINTAKKVHHIYPKLILGK